MYLTLNQKYTWLNCSISKFKYCISKPLRRKCHRSKSDKNLFSHNGKSAHSRLLPALKIISSFTLFSF